MTRSNWLGLADQRLYGINPSMSDHRANYHEIRYPESARGVDSLLWRNRLFYHAHLPISRLKKRYDLDGLMTTANSIIPNGRIMKDLEFQPAFELANMVKINAMLPSILRQGMHKPFLVAWHSNQQLMHVETGDSRLACLELTNITTVPAIIVCRDPQAPNIRVDLDGLVPLKDLQDIARVCGVEDTVFYVDFDVANRLTYLNFDISESSGVDCSSYDHRLKLLQRYLDQHWHQDFVFDRQWLRRTVPWHEYDDKKPALTTPGGV